MNIKGYKAKLIRKFSMYPYWYSTQEVEKMVDRYIGNATTMEEHLEHCKNIEAFNSK